MNERFSPLTERMKAVCTALKEQADAAEYEFSALQPKGTDCVSDCIAGFKFGSFDAVFIFNSKLGKVQNVLECRINLAGGEPHVDFSLYDLMYLLNENDFDCYLFPYIDSPDRMEACLKVLFSAVMKYKEQLNGIGGDEGLCTRAKNRKKKEMLRFFKHDIFTEVREGADPILAWRLRGYREWYVSRFCSRWYYDYVNERYNKAAKRLASFDSKCDYEIRMQRFLKALSSGASYTALPPEANTFTGHNPMKSARSTASFITTLLIGVSSSFAIYMMAGLASYYIIYKDALYSTSLNGGWIPLASLLCALPTGLATAKLLWRKLLSKEERNAIREAGIDLSGLEKRSRKGALHSSVICSLIIVFFAAKSGIAVYEDGIVDNTLPFESRSMHFSDLKEIYYEKETELYHLRFNGNHTFTCSSNMADEFILDNVDVEVREIDKIEEKES